MQRDEQGNGSQRRRARVGTRLLDPTERDAVRELIDAVHALSEDPRRANVDRYLAASRALEDVRLPKSNMRAA